MALDTLVKKTWQEVQSRYSYPVNALGMKIDSKDKETFRIWRENGIDQFMKK